MAAVAMAAFCAGGIASAQSPFPSKPVHIFVPYAAGGTGTPIHRYSDAADCEWYYGGNPGGFVVESAEGNFYYSGDTALTLDMKLIGESTPLTFAALCIGGNFTMDAQDAAKAAQFVNCNQILGLHYDTFPPIKIDHDEARKTFQAAGKNLHLLKIGETRQF